MDPEPDLFAEARERMVDSQIRPNKVTDPRTPALISIAKEEGAYGPHLRLFEAIGRVHPQILGRTLPLNGAGTCVAASKWIFQRSSPFPSCRGFLPMSW